MVDASYLVVRHHHHNAQGHQAVCRQWQQQQAVAAPAAAAAGQTALSVSNHSRACADVPPCSKLVTVCQHLQHSSADAPARAGFTNCVLAQAYATGATAHHLGVAAEQAQFPLLLTRTASRPASCPSFIQLLIPVW